ncbi:hypothetical protein RvY_06533 [Ramazzottius varieornatus]|uniref:RanBP2-type domain-containing protein n=1 Tax=Ramazzottius varieornatus TaxID=947166 RepID=A0A1D1V4D5_RAMVA|nr:hypothetical protein RvY_06533 [Ramazzottius varieornatus]
MSTRSDSRAKTSTTAKRKRVVEEDKWDCVHCTFKNASKNGKCAMCDIPRGTATRRPGGTNPQIQAQQELEEMLAKDRAKQRRTQAKQTSTTDLNTEVNSTFSSNDSVKSPLSPEAPSTSSTLEAGSSSSVHSERLILPQSSRGRSRKAAKTSISPVNDETEDGNATVRSAVYSIVHDGVALEFEEIIPSDASDAGSYGSDDSNSDLS